MERAVSPLKVHMFCRVLSGPDRQNECVLKEEKEGEEQ